MAGYGVNTAPISAVPHDLRPAPPKPVKSPATAAAHKGRTTTAPRPYDPFQPLTPAQIDQTVNKFASRYGQPQTPAQIQSSAQGMVDPIIAAITANVGAQTKQAGSDIAGSTASLAKALAGVDYGAPYAGAEGKQAAVDAALQQSLGKQGGTDLAQGLESRLSQIGGGSVQSAAQGLADRGAAIGTNQQAVGSTNLGQLISNEASAKAYGQKLPGIAQMQGLQDIAGVQAAGVKQIGDQTAQVTGQLPSIIENLRAAAQNLTGQKAAAAASLYGELTGQNITKATASAGLGLNEAKAQQTAAYDQARVQQGDARLQAQISQANARIGIAQQNANTASYRAQISAQTAAAKAAKKANPKLTPGQSATISAKAAKDAEDLYHGKQHTTAAGKTVVDSYTSTYQEAVKTLQSRYPSIGRQGAVQLANLWYKPGEFGRPKKANVVKSGGPLGVQARVPG